MFAQTREEVRAHFISVWQKMGEKAELEPLERLLANVIESHPEYHTLLAEPARALASDFAAQPAANPFLHMSLHVAIREQLQIDRPAGVVSAYNLMLKDGRLTAHAVEHKMMNCLSANLQQAQQATRAPDEAAYLSDLTQLT